MKTEYCAYPPQLVSDVEVIEQRDGQRLAFIAGSAAGGRYLLLGAAEREVLGLLDGSLAPPAVCREFSERRRRDARATHPDEISGQTR